MRIRSRSAAARKQWSINAHAAKARKRMEGPLRPPDAPKPLLRGVLQWTGADGALHRWIIRHGKRANGIAVCAKGKEVQCGFDRLLRAIRRHLVAGK